MRGSRRDPQARLALIAVTAALGIGPRRCAGRLPDLVAAYAGDALRALATSFGLGVLLPRAPAKQVAALAMTVSVAVEVSRLYHDAWIDSVRRTNPGGVVLGYDFVWSDPACYAVGVGLGILVERVGPHERSAPGT